MSGYGKQKETFEDKFAGDKTVVFHKRNTTTVSAASMGGQSHEASQARKLDDTDGRAPQLPHATHEQKQIIQQARVAKGLSQKQLANELNVMVKQIQDWEGGRGAPPSGAQKAKLQRKLGIKLPK